LIEKAEAREKERLKAEEERVGSSEDGKGSSNFRDSELVKTVGMRTDGCSVTGCIEERKFSDSNEAVEG